jgi:hypothetical protein
MPTISSATDSHGFWLNIGYTVTDYPAEGRSLVTANTTLRNNTAGMFSGYTLTTWLRVTYTVDGSSPITVTMASSHIQRSMSGTSLALDSGSQYINHNSDGTQSFTISAWCDADTNTTYTPSNLNPSGNVGMTTFVGPGQPGNPYLSRSSDGSSIGITSQTPSSGSAPITAYQFIWSNDNSNWNGPVGMSGNATSFAATTTAPYYLQTRAISNGGLAWGIGSYSGSSFVAGVPSSPSSISVSTSGRSATVNVGSSSTDGGASPTYWVRYSANGGAYSSAVQATGSPLSATFNNLAPNTNYTFQTYATNSTGSSTTTTASSVYIAAGGKRFDGTNWVSPSAVRRWDGGTWVDISISKRWSGTAWVDLT